MVERFMAVGADHGDSSTFAELLRPFAIDAVIAVPCFLLANISGFIHCILQDFSDRIIASGPSRVPSYMQSIVIFWATAPLISFRRSRMTLIIRRGVHGVFQSAHVGIRCIFHGCLPMRQARHVPSFLHA